MRIEFGLEWVSMLNTIKLEKDIVWVVLHLGEIKNILVELWNKLHSVCFYLRCNKLMRVNFPNLQTETRFHLLHMDGVMGNASGCSLSRSISSALLPCALSTHWYGIQINRIIKHLVRHAYSMSVQYTDWLNMRSFITYAVLQIEHQRLKWFSCFLFIIDDYRQILMNTFSEFCSYGSVDNNASIKLNLHIWILCMAILPYKCINSYFRPSFKSNIQNKFRH